MIAVDTNLLVYAHRRDSAWHEAAAPRLRELAEGRSPWAVPWPCILEFFAIVTHARIYDPPSKPSAATLQIDAWLASPSVVLLAETAGYWTELRGMLKQSRISGAAVHDARVAALCRVHGVRELWTADRDFSRFPGLRTRNPLV